MIYSTTTVPAKPEEETPLTRGQAWAGLVPKARDARLSLPPGLCTRCDVVEDGEPSRAVHLSPDLWRLDGSPYNGSALGLIPADSP